MEVMNHMDYEVQLPSADALQRYRDFMFNPSNIHNCSECPERCSGSNQDGLPCGQQVCWVAASCDY